MKTPALLILALSCLLSCSKQQESLPAVNKEPCPELSSFIETNYYTDARHLYYQRILDDSSHPSRNDFELSTDSITSILKDIQAVYCLDIPERDTVFELNDIHGYYCTSYNSLGIRVDPNFDHIQKLAAQEFPTGNAELDQILSAFNLDSVDLAYSFPQFPWLSLVSQLEGNNLVYMSALEGVAGIEVVELYRGCVGDGNTISHQQNSNSKTLTFSIGSGDCPSGCLYHRYWEFAIKDGKAEFVRMYED